MPKSITKELTNEIRRVLEEQINGGPGTYVILKFGTDSIKIDAVNFLADLGVLHKEGSSSYRLTATGREYWDKINTPRPIYWFKQNRLPALVAAATIAASITGAVAIFL